MIPAYNEEKNIRMVIDSLKYQSPEIDIVIINDGSTDNTAKEIRQAWVKVINLSQNLGIGGAVQTGFIYAKRNNYDVVIQVDGDGQHDPKDLNKLVEPIKKKEADMVIGSRFVEKTAYKSSRMRKAGIYFFSKLVSFICKKKYYDTTSGFRAFNKKGIELFANYYPKDYPEVEALVFAAKRGLMVREVSVNMYERKSGKSSITPLKSVYYMVKVTFAIILQP